jgi:hypothetical protein
MAGSKISSGTGKPANRMRTVADFKAKGKQISDGFKPGGYIDVAVKASRAAKAAAPTTGMGVMSNGPAAKPAVPSEGIKARRNTIVDAYKTGGVKAVRKAFGDMGSRGRKKPFGTL